MRAPSFLALAVVPMLACNPTDEAADATGTTSPTDTTDATDPAPTTGDAARVHHCDDSRWELLDVDSDEPRRIVVDARGHLRVHNQLRSFEHQILDIDGEGQRVGSLVLGAEGLYFLAGADAASAVHITTRGQPPGAVLRLRKYTPDHAMVADVDLGPAVEVLTLAPAIAPDGAAIVSTRSKIFRREADGAVAWEIANDPAAPLAVMSVNADGVSVGSEPISGRIHVLEPDGSTRWTVPFAGFGGAGTRIDDAGRVLAVADGTTLVRFAADGSELWQRSSDDLGLTLLNDLTMNAAGTIAVTGPKSGTSVDLVLVLDEAGLPMATHTCSAILLGQIALDAAGGVYVTGAELPDGRYVAWVAAF